MVIRITPAGKMPAVRECLLCHARWQAFLAIAALIMHPQRVRRKYLELVRCILFRKMGHFARRGQKSDLPARIRRQEETGRRRHFWEAEIIRSAWDMYRFSPGSSRMRWKPHSGGELFFRIWICRL